MFLPKRFRPQRSPFFQQEPSWQVVTADKVTNLEAELAEADALVVRSAVQVTSALLEHAPKLRVIGRAGVGVDNIDADSATKRGIVVMNTPGANAVAVAELTLGLMITMARQVPKATAALHNGKWEKKTLQGTELRGKTLGHRRPGSHRTGGCAARPQLRHGSDWVRPLCGAGDRA